MSGRKQRNTTSLIKKKKRARERENSGGQSKANVIRLERLEKGRAGVPREDFLKLAALGARVMKL